MIQTAFIILVRLVVVLFVGRESDDEIGSMQFFGPHIGNAALALFDNVLAYGQSKTCSAALCRKVWLE